MCLYPNAQEINVLLLFHTGFSVKLVCVISYSDERKYARPGRPCTFCGVEIRHSKLTRHISMKHKANVEVKEAMAMNKIGRLRKNSEFKKRAILCQNKAALGNSKYMPTLCSGRSLAHSNVVVCRRCGGFYARKTFYRHQRRCLSKDDTS